MTRPWLPHVLMAMLLAGPLGCRPPSGGPPEVAVTGPAASAPRLAEAEAALVDWASAPDCHGKLRLLQTALLEDQIEDLEGTPFAVIDEGMPSSLRIWSAIDGGAPSPLAAARADADPAVRCVIRLGKVLQPRAAHRVLGREQVQSAYQGGSRSERNPEYEAAQARLRQAEKAAKPGRSSIIKVGDPLLDLVGTVIGGALTSIGQWSAGDEVEAAIETLLATPRSIEQPLYQPYRFERARVQASREASIPVVLTDRQLRQSWRSTLRRREVRDFVVLDGLDRRDRAYARHVAAGITESDLLRWEAEAPLPPLADLVAGLLDNPQAAAADAGPTGAEARAAPATTGPIDGGVVDEGDLFDAAALPAAYRPFRRSDGGIGRVREAHGAPMPAGGARAASVVEVAVDGRQGQGVYVTTGFVLTSSALIGTRDLVDVGDGAGPPVLGLVAALDRQRGLALVQVPRPGEPVPLQGGPAAGPAIRRAEAAARFGVAASSQAGSSMFAGRRRAKGVDAGNAKEGGPLFAGDALAGLHSLRGADIAIGDIKAFLAEHAGLLAER